MIEFTAETEAYFCTSFLLTFFFSSKNQYVVGLTQVKLLFPRKEQEFRNFLSSVSSEHT